MDDGDKDAVRDAFAERSKHEGTAALIAADQAGLERELHDLVEGARASLVELRRLQRPLPSAQQQADIATALLFVGTFPRPQGGTPPPPAPGNNNSSGPPPPAPGPAPSPQQPPAGRAAGAGMGHPTAGTGGGGGGTAPGSPSTSTSSASASTAPPAAAPEPASGVRGLPHGAVSARHALEALNGRRVALWSPAARGWLSSHRRGLTGIMGSYTALGPKLSDNQLFILDVASMREGQAALQSVAISKYIGAQPSGSIDAGSSRRAEWETLTLLPVPADQASFGAIALRTCHGRLLSATSDGSGVEAKGASLDARSTWWIFDGEEAARRYSGGGPM